MTTQPVGPSIGAPFSEAEFEARRDRVRERMRAGGFDGLLVADPANLYYLTGYNAWSFYTPQVLWLPLEGEPLLIMREMDANGAHRTATSFPASSILGYPETLIHRPDAHPGDWIAAALLERAGAEPRRVGYEGEAHFFTVRTFRALQEHLPGWQLDDSQDLVGWVRLVKSPAEIELMRAAGRIASSAMQAGLDALAPGRPQHEIAAAIQAAQARGTADAAGDYPAIVPLMMVGAAADTPHLTWSDAPLPDETGISLELTGAHRRYHAPLARTAYLGTPSDRLRHLADATVAALDAALAAVRPGVTAHEVSEEFTRVLGAAGYEKASRLGYSIGIGYPPDWGERTVSLRRGEPTVLVENMTFHVIAGMWMTGYGFETSASIRVTDSGHELFCDVPRGLIVKNGGAA
ncbi:M24 family metallopeptidase [Gulosibacter faecalis]|uniref:M24 family metallopeptidase n=1 Tax=Gulosibacter faecalis TaxID=272240 RepID=A0ABW5UYI9_9MICO|nr:M24 family metallopeptidase [Gulosibacter faecalis]